MDKTSIKTVPSQTGVRPSVIATPNLPALAVESNRRQQGPIVRALTALASLRLTVVLFVLSMILVLAGTLAQIDHGIWTVVARYFRWFYVWIPFQIFFPRSLHIPGGFPFPGGYTIGGALLVNLLAAHAMRFKLTWKRSGILVLHAGLIVMMLGELVTGLFAVEARMTIAEGSTVNYVEASDSEELVFLTTSKDNAKMDDVVAIPGSKLRKGGVIHDDKLPVDVVVEKYMRSSDIPDVPPKGVKNRATAGDGLNMVAIEKEEASGVDSNQGIDIPSAYVTFKDKQSGEALGTYLVSVYLTAFGDMPQRFNLNGTAYEASLRFKRTYKPYSLQLIKFSHDLYDGTDIPKNYSSLVQLEDPARNTNREVLIWMNHPMFYDGDTFYQADFLKGQQRGTILQVVHNPGWTMPYISCALVALGMMLHFGTKLVNFLHTQLSSTQVKNLTGKPLNVNRNGKPLISATSFDWSTIGVVSFAVVGALLYLVVALVPSPSPAGRFNYSEAGKIQVTDGGRSKPLDSVARNKLMIISGKQSFLDNEQVERSAMEWLCDVMTSRFSQNGKAESYKVFRIENLEVLNLLGLPEKPGSYRYSISEMIAKGNMEKLEQERDRAQAVPKKSRTLFDFKVLALADHLEIYQELALSNVPLIVAPQKPGEQPLSLRSAVTVMKQSGVENPQVNELMEIFGAYSTNDVSKFNSIVASYRNEQAHQSPVKTEKAEFETFFNHFAPFYQCMVLYVIIFILAAFSWLVFQKPLNRAAFWLTLLVLLVHTCALGARIYILDRPPIINLYSTATFIGWMAVLLLLIFECFFKYGVATFLAGVIGFMTLFIAHMLSLDGDTMEMLQAVLDTNFWLATHVVAVNIGYAGTLVAGFLGILYIKFSIYNNYTRAIDRKLLSDVASRMLYGVVCFAMFFSFVGTVLGGLWADYSWGRFWGWDPKENGALLIVIWNAVILHARWGGLVKARGMAVLAVFGNIVVSWSWFGVNMLNVGLHSYGPLAGATSVLIAWDLIQIAYMIVGMIPRLHEWQTTPDKNNFKVA